MARDPNRRDRCLDEFGLTYYALCTLVAVVARHRCGAPCTSAPQITELLRDTNDVRAVADGFRELERLRLVRRVAKLGNQIFFVPTRIGVTRVGWAGRSDAA
jgi:hypothetical protein